MKKILAGAILAACILCGNNVSAVQTIVTKPVEYAFGTTVMKGYLALDAGITGKRPGVLVVHEWWGHNDYARSRARMLAELGYTALAVDMYGDGKQALHPDEAKQFSSETLKNFDVAKGRFIAALDFLKQQPSVDPDRIAAIGYCFGGGLVLNLARDGLDLRGVASFHGSLAARTPVTRSGVIKTRIIVFHGADDKMVPPEQVEAFRKEMSAAGADYRFFAYPGALHSFTNPDADAYAKKFNMPIAYNEQADKQSWEEMKKFLQEIFGK